MSGPIASLVFKELKNSRRNYFRGLEGCTSIVLIVFRKNNNASFLYIKIFSELPFLSIVENIKLIGGIVEGRSCSCLNLKSNHSGATVGKIGSRN